MECLDIFLFLVKFGIDDVMKVVWFSKFWKAKNSARLSV